MSAEITAECVVVGAGPAGLAAAAALAGIGADVALAGLDASGIAPVSHDASPAAGAAGSHSRSGIKEDTRTAALLPASIVLLQRLGAWTHCRPASAPLQVIRIVDATGTILRAPEVTFAASEIGWPDFGWNVPQTALAAGLRQVIAGRVRFLAGGQVEAVQPDGTSAVVLTIADGTRVRTRLVIAADGRNSLCRKAAGIAVKTWPYPQTAIATRFRHSRPHHGVTTELHTPAGPCTTVPLPGLASSLVWVERPDEAQRLMELPEHDFLAGLELRLGGLLGTLSDLSDRRGFPLSGLAADLLGARRIALVGEAGHVIPPIGAQGLNLGLLDAAVLADVVADARRHGADIGSEATLATYSAARRTDIERRIGAVDVVNRMLISGFLPVSLLRGFGLHLLAASPMLRRRLMLKGLQPPGALPSLMREPDPSRHSLL